MHYDAMVAGLVELLSGEIVSSAQSIRRQVGEYVANVYRYHRQYIYDVVLYQYRQDQLMPTEPSHQLSGVLRDILGDAQQVGLGPLYPHYE